jgi:hypothetical protein
MRCGRPHVSSRNRSHADKLLERSPLNETGRIQAFRKALNATASDEHGYPNE